MTARLHTTLFHRHPGIAGFDCGNDTLDIYFRQFAGQHHRRGITRVYLIEEADSGRLIGYFGLVSAQITSAMLEHNPEGLPSVIGATLLARLAIDKDVQGQGLGGLVLFEALRVIVEAADIVAAPVIIVDAIDERASSFYRRFGFEPLASDPLHLVLSMKAARLSVGSPQ